MISLLKKTTKKTKTSETPPPTSEPEIPSPISETEFNQVFREVMDYLETQRDMDNIKFFQRRRTNAAQAAYWQNRVAAYDKIIEKIKE